MLAILFSAGLVLGAESGSRWQERRRWLFAGVHQRKEQVFERVSGRA
jgi:hypothetical protein